jgi:hypothetical protein
MRYLIYHKYNYLSWILAHACKDIKRENELIKIKEETEQWKE